MHHANPRSAVTTSRPPCQNSVSCRMIGARHLRSQVSLPIAVALRDRLMAGCGDTDTEPAVVCGPRLHRRAIATRKGIDIHSQPPPRRRRVRLWLLAATTVGVLTVTVAAGIALKPSWFGLVSTADRTAQQRCESDVRSRLAAPTTARLTNVRSTRSDLEPDSRDLFPLMVNEPLKGVDRSRITVWSVSGTVDAPTEVGSMIHDPFTCRAYFVDGTLADSLVLFDHEH